MHNHNRMVPMFAFLAGAFGFGWAYMIYYQKAVSTSLLIRRFAWIYLILKNKYFIDEIYMFFVRHLIFAVSDVLAWFDRHVVDGTVNGIAWLCRRLGDGMRHLQVGRLQAYVLVFVVGLIVMTVTVFITQPVFLALIP